MNANRRFNSIARRIHRAWQWKKLGLLVLVNAAAFLACALAYLYAKETAVTGAFVGWGLPRALAMEGRQWQTLRYVFTFQEAEHIVPLADFLDLAFRFGRPLLIAEGALWLLGFLGGAKDARRMLKPLNRMAAAAQRLSDEAARPPKEATAPAAGVDEAKFHSLEHAIEQIDIGDRLSTGDKDLRGLEDAINDLLNRMQEAYRQQAQFVYDASHELRTPIAVIQGYVNMLDRWGKQDEKVLDESIAAIKDETAHMKTLVEQLLFLARGDSGRQQLNPEPMDLAEMMAGVLEEYRMIDPGHDWRQGRMEPAPAQADPALIKQAARVLIDNAVRYTPEGGSIRLGAGAREGQVYIEVQDGGIGIDEADVPRIFDRFYRADKARSRQGGGTGLGLSIARWIVERHGGHFEVISRAGIGTRMRVVLPRAEAVPAAKPDSAPEAG